MEGDVTDQVLGCYMHVLYISGEPIPKPWIVNKDSSCEVDQIVLTELQTLRCFYGHPDSLRTVKWWSADRLMEKWNLWLLYGIFLVWIDSSQNIGDTFYPMEGLCNITCTGIPESKLSLKVTGQVWWNVCERAARQLLKVFKRFTFIVILYAHFCKLD